MLEKLLYVNDFDCCDHDRNHDCDDDDDWATELTAVFLRWPTVSQCGLSALLVLSGNLHA